MAKLLPKLRDVLLGLIGLICLLIAVKMGYYEKIAAAGILFSAGIVLCILSSLSNFESFKGLGVEAKMKVLDTKIDEAEALLVHIRNTVGLTAEISFLMMGRMGRWDSMVPKDVALSISDRLVRKLRELGANDSEVEKWMSPWIESNIFDLIVPISNKIQGFVQIQNQEFSAALQKFTHPIDASDSEWKRLNDAIRKNSDFLEKVGTLWRNDAAEFLVRAEELILKAPHGSEAEKQELIRTLAPQIEEARYYATHKEFKDREKWVKTPYGH